MPYVHVNDVRLFYEETGAGEPLVLVHGSWSDHHNFDAVVPALARTFRVVAYDRRGHSLSERPSRPATRREQEDELALLIEALGLGPAHLVGTSFGAAIALGLATRRPDLVRTLTAHEPALPALDPRTRPVQERIVAAVARVACGDAEGGARQFVEEVALGPGGWELLPQTFRTTMVRNAPAMVDEGQDPAWSDIDGDALSALPMPFLLTRGAQSPGWFEGVVAAVRAIAGPDRAHTYTDAGHSPHITHPGEYVAVVSAFATASEGVATHA
jgi:pimeloyl-ACP methyl ester carboxylesterase